MTPDEIAELKRLAEASHEVDSICEWYSPEACEDFDVEPVDAVFIAAMKPETILRLIAHVEALQSKIRQTAYEHLRTLDELADAQARIDRALSPACIDYGHMDVALERVREALTGTSGKSGDA